MRRGATIKKFDVPNNPIENEYSLNELVPTDEQSERDLLKIVDTMIDNAEKRDLPELKSLRVYRANLLIKSARKGIKENYVLNFQLWLLGRGREVDHQKTWWGRQSLANDNEVSDYVDMFYEKMMEYKVLIKSLTYRLPNGIYECWIYYKYIVRQQDFGFKSFLEDWNILTQDFWRARRNGQNYRDDRDPKEFPNTSGVPKEMAPYGELRRDYAIQRSNQRVKKSGLNRYLGNHTPIRQGGRGRTYGRGTTGGGVGPGATNETGNNNNNNNPTGGVKGTLFDEDGTNSNTGLNDVMSYGSNNPIDIVPSPKDATFYDHDKAKDIFIKNNDNDDDIGGVISGPTNKPVPPPPTIITTPAPKKPVAEVPVFTFDPSQNDNNFSPDGGSGGALGGVATPNLQGPSAIDNFRDNYNDFNEANQLALQNQIDNLNKELEDARSGKTTAEKSLIATQNAVNHLKNQINEQQNAMKQLPAESNKEIENIKSQSNTQLNHLQQELQTAQDQHLKLQNQIKENNDKMELATNVLKNQQASLEEKTAQLRTYEDHIQKLELNASQNVIDKNNAINGANNMVGTLQEVKQAGQIKFTELNNKIQEQQQQINQQSNIMKQQSSKLKQQYDQQQQQQQQHEADIKEREQNVAAVSAEEILERDKLAKQELNKVKSDAQAKINKANQEVAQVKANAAKAINIEKVKNRDLTKEGQNLVKQGQGIIEEKNKSIQSLKQERQKYLHELNQMNSKVQSLENRAKAIPALENSQNNLDTALKTLRSKNAEIERNSKNTINQLLQEKQSVETAARKADQINLKKIRDLEMKLAQTDPHSHLSYENSNLELEDQKAIVKDRKKVEKSVPKLNNKNLLQLPNNHNSKTTSHENKMINYQKQSINADSAKKTEDEGEALVNYAKIMSAGKDKNQGQNSLNSIKAETTAANKEKKRAEKLLNESNNNIVRNEESIQRKIDNAMINFRKQDKEDKKYYNEHGVPRTVYGSAKQKLISNQAQGYMKESSKSPPRVEILDDVIPPKEKEEVENEQKDKKRTVREGEIDADVKPSVKKQLDAIIPALPAPPIEKLDKIEQGKPHDDKKKLKEGSGAAKHVGMIEVDDEGTEDVNQVRRKIEPLKAAFNSENPQNQEEAISALVGHFSTEYANAFNSLPEKDQRLLDNRSIEPEIIKQRKVVLDKFIGKIEHDKAQDERRLQNLK